MGLTPDQIASLSPGELEAMRSAWNQRRLEDYEAMAVSVANGIVKAFGKGD